MREDFRHFRMDRIGNPKAVLESLTFAVVTYRLGMMSAPTAKCWRHRITGLETLLRACKYEKAYGFVQTPSADLVQVMVDLPFDILSQFSTIPSKSA